VLREIKAREKHRYDVGAEMFREMLCSLDLCDYGTSPRTCFPTTGFDALLDTLIDKWRDWSFIQWGVYIEEDADD